MWSGDAMLATRRPCDEYSSICTLRGSGRYCERRLMDHSDRSAGTGFDFSHVELEADTARSVRVLEEDLRAERRARNENRQDRNTRSGNVRAEKLECALRLRHGKRDDVGANRFLTIRREIRFDRHDRS